MIVKVDYPFATKDLRLLALDCDGTMTDGAMYLNDAGHEFKRFSFRDGMGTRIWREKMGGQVIMLTGENSMVALRRAEKLKFDAVYMGQTLDGKGSTLLDYMDKHGLDPENVVVMGDDINDLSMRPYCKYFAAPSDAHPDVLKVADLITSAPGGHGAVRELVDYLMSMPIELEAW